jgi:hypothetical protein
MISTRKAVAAAAATVLLAACSGGPHVSSTAAAGPAGATGSAGASGPAKGSGSSGHPGTNSPAATSSPAGNTPGSAASAGRLTMRQAAAAYVRIVQPGSTMADKLAVAASGTAPFSQFRTDALAYAKELRTEIGKFRAVRWPTTAQARINAMVKTDFPADIACLQAMSAAGGTAASQAVAGSDHNCMVADNSTIPGTLQSLLSQ